MLVVLEIRLLVNQRSEENTEQKHHRRLYRDN